MKKILAILLCLLFCLSLASCAEKEETKSKNSSTKSSSSAVVETSSETKATETSKTSSKAKKEKKKNSSKKSSESSKKASKSKKISDSSSKKKISRLEKLICNSRGWKSRNSVDEEVLIHFLSGGAAKVQVFNSKGVLVHNKMEYSVWSLNGENLTLNNSASSEKAAPDHYKFKNIRDNVLDNAPLEKTNKKYINYILLESTGLNKNEFYVSNKYFCYYAGSESGKDYCKLYRTK